MSMGNSHATPADPPARRAGTPPTPTPHESPPSTKRPRSESASGSATFFDAIAAPAAARATHLAATIVDPRAMFADDSSDSGGRSDGDGPSDSDAPPPPVGAPRMEPMDAHQQVPAVTPPRKRRKCAAPCGSSPAHAPVAAAADASVTAAPGGSSSCAGPASRSTSRRDAAPEQEDEEEVEESDVSADAGPGEGPGYAGDARRALEHIHPRGPPRAAADEPPAAVVMRAGQPQLLYALSAAHHAPTTRVSRVALQPCPAAPADRVLVCLYSLADGVEVPTTASCSAGTTAFPLPGTLEAVVFVARRVGARRRTAAAAAAATVPTRHAVEHGVAALRGTTSPGAVVLSTAQLTAIASAWHA